MTSSPPSTPALRTLFLQAPSFDGFDGGAGSRYQARREVKSFWYPTWLAQPAALVAGSRLLDAPAQGLSVEQCRAIARDYELVIMHTSTPSFASDVKVAAALKEASPGIKIGFVGAKVAVDAEGSLKNIDNSIDDILDAAAQRQLTVIWVGPHCVRKGWDKQSSELDQILRSHLAKSSVKYIGTRQDAGLCSGKFQEPDGVHLTAKGYRYMWAMIDGAGGTPNTAIASAPQKPNDAATKPAGADLTTASLLPRPAQPRVDHRLVMEIHIPGAPSEPLVWTRSQN